MHHGRGDGGHTCSHEPCTEADLLRIGHITRTRFRLGKGWPVMVEQLAATERGFPPFETRIAFWTGNGQQHRYRIFKQASQVTNADFPPWWMKDALIVDAFPFCDCCG